MKMGGAVQGRHQAREIYFAALALGMFLLALSAPLLATSHPFASLAIRSFFSRLCHQDPARSFIVDGNPVAVCVRCLGIYCGTAIGAGLSMLLRIRAKSVVHLFLLALLANGMDVAAEILHWHNNLPLLRFSTGAALGLALGMILTLPEALRER